MIIKYVFIMIIKENRRIPWNRMYNKFESFQFIDLRENQAYIYLISISYLLIDSKILETDD